MNIIKPMAGIGTRLRPHTLTTPKPLIRFAGKAMVEHIIDEIALSLGNGADGGNVQIDEIGFVCGHFGKKAEKELIECASAKGAKGHIFYQDEPLGTGHAILRAKPLLHNEVIVAFADTLFISNEKMLPDNTGAVHSGKQEPESGQTSGEEQADVVIFTSKVKNPQAFGVVITDETGRINGFMEKPQVFISDEAIIGIYYFRDGEILRGELQNLIDNDFRRGKEYQLTDALENMLKRNINFVKANVKEWLDCGNKDAAINTHSRLLEQKSNLHYISPNATVSNSEIIRPCYIADGVILEDAVIGPFVSLEKKSTVKKSTLKHSIIQQETIIENSILTKSMLGTKTVIKNHNGTVSIGDYSEVV
jgi:glucose-1-phosphate thymidylyltransferase